MANKGLFAVSLIAALAAGAAGHYFYEQSKGAALGDVVLTDTGAPADTSTVLVTVNGQPITQAQLETRKRMIAEKVGGMFLQLPEAEKDRVVKENLILEALVDQNMKDSTIAEDPIVAQQLRESRQQVLRTAYLDKMAEAAVSDDALRATYDAQVAKLPDETEVHARHILVKDEAAAKEVIAKLKAGMKFEDLAREFSLDKGNAAQGGDLGFFTKEQMVPEFANIAFSMKPGEVTQTPVKTPFGWHVVEVLESRVKPKPTFEEVKGGLAAQERQRVIKETIEKWRTSATIEDKTAPVAETTDALETTDSAQVTPPASEAEAVPTTTEEAVEAPAVEATPAPEAEEAAPAAEAPAAEAPAAEEAPASTEGEAATTTTPAY